MSQEILSVYKAAGLDAEDISLMPDYLEGTEEFYDTPAFNKLYEYLCFETGEMPYGVAKARTETPDVWILDYIGGMA
tara:strand:+ start:71 stop:301 length:231 start_codon:yes stop_codon:yes gene_type:complete